MKKTLSLFTAMFVIALFHISCTKELPEYEDAPVVPTSPATNGTTWATCGGAIDGAIHDLFVFDNKLFIAGNFFHVGTSQTTGNAYWNGSVISPVYLSGVGGSGFTNFAVHDNQLFGGGAFSQFLGTSMCAKWDGSTWQAGNYAINGNVNAIQSFNGQLYIGGFFNNYNSVNYNRIAVHDGTGWQRVGQGFNTSVNAMAVFNNELYAGGEFTGSGSTIVNYIAKWNGNAWEQVGTTGLNGRVYTMKVFNNELYVGGSFTQADGNNARYIAKWNGTSWSNVGGSITGGFNGVKTLYVHGGELFVGGDFTTAGTTPVMHIAKWNGLTWGAIGTNLTGIVTGIAVYNGSLYAGTLDYSGDNYLWKFQ